MKVNREMLGRLQWKASFLLLFVCIKGVGSDSILCQFCRCWMCEGCSGIRGSLKEDSKFKCQRCANQQTCIAEDCLGTELDGQSLEIMENFCYFGDTVRARKSVLYSVITRIRSRWCKFRDLVPLIVSRGLPLGAKGRRYSA